MIAIPVKTNSENSAVTTLFGKARWFAFIDKKGGISIEKNRAQNGREVVSLLVDKGVDTLIFHHIGGNPFMLLQKAKVACYHSGGERILLNDVLEKFKNDALVKVDGNNMEGFVEKGHSTKIGGHHKHHEHHEHHKHAHRK